MLTVREKAQRAYRAFLEQPELFVELVLGQRLWDKQVEIVRSVFDNKRTAVKSGHKIGKTNVAAAICITFIHLKRPSRCITTAPTGRQVRELLWQEIHSMHRKARDRGIPLGGELLELKYRLGPNHYALGFSSDKREAGVNFQGFSGDVLAILDEAGGVPAVVWEVLETMMVQSGSRILALGNPHDPATQFYTCFNSKLWNAITVSSWDTPNAQTGREVIPGLATKSWCEERLQEWGQDDPRYLFRVLGIFPEGSAFSLIKRSWCREAAERTPLKGGRRVGGLDVARFGDDLTVFTSMYEQGHINKVKSFSGLDIVQVAGQARRMYEEEEWDLIAVDDTGVGGGVTDLLRRMSVDRVVEDPRTHAKRKEQVPVNVLPVNFGAAARRPDKHEDAATEMYDDLASDLKCGRISGLSTGNVVQELINRRYSFNAVQAMKLEPKKEFKKRLNRSPDEADSLMLANAARRYVGMSNSDKAQVF